MAFGLKNFTKYGYTNILKKTNRHSINNKTTTTTTTSYYKHTSAYYLGLKNNDDNNSHSSSMKYKKNNLHSSSFKNYPSAPSLTLPDNMIQIFDNETCRFNKERSRDITGPVLICQSKLKSSYSDSSIIDIKDLHSESYDCINTVSLNSSMQSNVPEPFSSDGKSMHLNMPGGESARDDKYIAQDMQNSHYSKVVFVDNDNNNNNNHRSIKSIDRKGDGNVDIINGRWFKSNDVLFNSNKNYRQIYNYNVRVMNYNTKADIDGDTKTKKTTSSKDIEDNEDSKIDNNVEKLSSAQKLKRAVKDYGITVVVFHVGISLTSLGISYLIISSGIDVPNIINSLGYFDDEKMKNILSNSSTFVIAYAVHKLFAPVRISITLATTPFLVRYLRKIGILKIK